jgi:hypothetical protein
VVYHRRDRVRAYPPPPCWLALLLIRVIEISTGDTWGNLCDELDRLHLLTLATPCRPAPLALRADPVRNHPRTLQLPEPPRFFEFTPAS